MPLFNPFKFKEPTFEDWEKYVAVGLGFFSFILIIPSIILAPLSFKYLAVKRKQPFLMFLANIFGFIWFIGTASSNGFFNSWFKGIDKTYMKIPCISLNLIAYYYGCIGWALCLVTRLTTLFLINQARIKISKIFSTIILLVLMVIPTFIFATVGILSIFFDFFVKPEFSQLNLSYDCRIGWPTTLVVFGLVVFILFLLTGLSIVTCKTRREFNESWIEIIGIGLCAIISLFVILCWTISLNWLRPIRILNLFQSLIVGYYYTFAVLGNVLFRALTCQFKWFESWEKDFKRNTKKLIEEKRFNDQWKERKRGVSNASREKYTTKMQNGELFDPFMDSESDSDYETHDYEMKDSM